MKGPPISKPKTRVLSDEEIRALWGALDGRPEVARVIRLCLVTGQRVGEVAGMASDELDLTRRVWNIPGTRTKNGHPHSVPLSPLALDIINEAPSRGLSAGNISCAIYYDQFGLPRRWSAHDCRRTALTKMAELGIPPIVLGHVANHRTTTKAGITLGVYVQHAYEREKREALELWASRLQGIISGGADIVAMRRS